jgi:hypothetical protein
MMGGSVIALSDQLSKLSIRAKQAEDHAAAAQGKAKADFDQQVKEGRESAQVQGDALRKTAESGKGKLSAWWESVQRSRNEHLAAVRKSMDDRKAEHDLTTAQRVADQAEDDAAFAIDYAYAAIEE